MKTHVRAVVIGGGVVDADGRRYGRCGGLVGTPRLPVPCARAIPVGGPRLDDPLVDGESPGERQRDVLLDASPACRVDAVSERVVDADDVDGPSVVPRVARAAEDGRAVRRERAGERRGHARSVAGDGGGVAGRFAVGRGNELLDLLRGPPSGYRRDAADFLAFLEGYSMDADYSTRTFLAGTRGQDEIDYEDEISYIYEFVEDNDDQDRRPDWNRYSMLSDNAVFPGFDENNDFVSDFNQNDTEDRQNFIPDYEEPFLRYHADEA